eukprot:augustus_masked-scaffold_62-processed-gene-0.19-mRNA-1 protein AED:1.00 eAED:1.00 QI:0/0/0/0/1/1/2/0/470
MNLYEADSTKSSGTDDDSIKEPSQSLNFETSNSSTTPEETNLPEDDEETPATAPVEPSTLDTEGTQQHPIFKQTHSRTGRTLKLPKRFENSLNYFVYETSESKKHKIKNRTPRQKEKLKEMILDSKLKQHPRMYKDLANHPQKEEYDKAIQKELHHIHSRNVLSIVKRSEINTNDEVGKSIFVLTRKRSGLAKARLVFNGLDFLGCVIERDELGNYYLQQESYLRKTLNKFQSFIKISNIPIQSDFDTQPVEKLKHKVPFRECLGSLGFLRHARLDILLALSKIATGSTEPSVKHWIALQSLLGYLQQNRSFKRTFRMETITKFHQIVAVVDASFATNAISRRSTSGRYLYLDSTLVSAHASNQAIIATSAPNAELYEVYRATKHLLYIQGLVTEMTNSNAKLGILTDSASTVKTLQRPLTLRYKFAAVQVAFIKSHLKNSNLTVAYISRQFNFSDALTKPLEFTTFNKF